MEEMSKATDIRSMDMEELKHLAVSLGEKPFRAKQLFSWLHEKRVEDYEEMTNLSKTFRERLKQAYPLTVLRPVDMQESQIDGTRKYLFALDDGNVIESV